MKKYLSIMSTFILILVLLILPIRLLAKNEEKKSAKPYGKSAVELREQERKLWQDHVLWTRNAIVSDLASLEDKNVVLERLFKNQEEIGNSIKPYYGEKMGEKLTELLKEHINIAGKIVDAAQLGNKEDLAKENKLWYENADKIVEFLNGLNSNWSMSTIKNMLYEHLQLVTDQLVARVNKDWQADIEAYDKGEKHMLNFADILSEGIIKQFPNKFSN